MENSPAEESPEEPAEEPVVDNNSNNEEEEVTAAVLLPIREEEANQNEDRESGGVGEEAGNVELSSSVEDTGGRKSKGETEEATGEESSAPAQQEGDNNEEAPKGEKAGAPEGEEQELKSVKSSPATLKAENSFEKKEKRKKKKEKKQVEIQQPLQAQPQAPVQEPIRKRISQTTTNDDYGVVSHRCSNIDEYKSRTVAHIPEGYSKRYENCSEKRMMLKTDPKGVKHAMLHQTAATRNALRARLPSFVETMYGGGRKRHIFMTFSERLESRPQMLNCLDGPSPTTYTPPVQPLRETTAPSYTFGSREVSKVGGGRISWARPYMRSNGPFNFKTDYETAWPSPFSYPQKGTVAERQIVKKTFPSYSIAKKLDRPTSSTPAVNIYCVEKAVRLTKPTAPAVLISTKAKPWKPHVNTPPPDYYMIEPANRKAGAAFKFSGATRFLKRHQTGPFCST